MAFRKSSSGSTSGPGGASGGATSFEAPERLTSTHAPSTPRTVRRRQTEPPSNCRSITPASLSYIWLMTASDPFALLARALDQTGSLIARTKPDQASLPTPCSGWDLRTLVNHTAYDVHVFTTMVTGAERPSPDVDLIDGNWSAAFQKESDALVAAWRSRGAEGTIKSRLGELPATWVVGQHLSDVAVHAWDVARSTSQSTELDPEDRSGSARLGSSESQT